MLTFVHDDNATSDDDMFIAIALAVLKRNENTKNCVLNLKCMCSLVTFIYNAPKGSSINSTSKYQLTFRGENQIGNKGHADLILTNN